MDATLPVVTREEIAAGLRRLGIAEGQEILLHSSLKSFGRVDGGADAVIDAFLNVLGPSGTLVCPTLTFRGFEATRPVFDSRTLPSETGLITETLRRRPGALRSLHPLSSVTAFGAAAEELTAWHDDTPCGPGTPYWKLWERGALVVFAGATLKSNSLFHVAEEIASPPYLSYDYERDVQVIDRHGRTYVRTFRRYACSRLGIPRYLGKMHPVYQERGALREGRIGNSRILLLSARDSVNLAVEVLKANPEWITQAE